MAVGLIAAASGCSANHGQYSMLSNKAITFSNVTAKKLAEGTPAYGESTCFLFFIFPLSTCSLNKALDQALGSSDLLTDAQVTYEQVNLAPLFRTDKWKVTGKAVKTTP
jgi:hypothetical protein